MNLTAGLYRAESNVCAMREGLGMAAVGFFVLLCGVVALALGLLGGIAAIAVGIVLIWAGVHDSRIEYFTDERPNAPKDYTV